MSELRIGNWSVQSSADSVYLLNMSNLNNCISVHKNKGYGDKRFYVAYNNASYTEMCPTLRDLERFIDTKFIRKQTMPEEIFNKFVEELKKYQ